MDAVESKAQDSLQQVRDVSPWWTMDGAGVMEE